MNAWLMEAARILNLTLSHPLNSQNGLIVAAAALLTLLIMLRVSGAAVGLENCGWARQITAVVLGLALVLGVAVAMSFYLDPLVGDPEERILTRIVVLALAVLVLVIPLLRIVLRGHYGQVLVACGLATVTALLVVGAVKAMLAAVADSELGLERIKKRTIMMDQDLGR